MAGVITAGEIAIDQVMEKINLRLLWYPQAQFVGALLAEHHDFARRRGYQLECQPVDFSEGPVSAIQSGHADLCIASPSHMLESPQPESLVFLLTFQQSGSCVYLARKDHDIDSIRCLAGKRIAVWPGSEDLELKWMLFKAGVPLSAIEFVPTVDTVQMLMEGQVSCAQMTTYNEYLKFLKLGGDESTVLTLHARDYDADLIKDGVVALKSWVESDTGRVQAVVDSLLAGWTHALSHRSDAIDLCKRIRADVEEEHHQMQYCEIKKLIVCGATNSHGLGFPHTDHLKKAASAVSDVEDRQFDFDVNRLVDTQYWQAAEPSLRRTAW